MNEEAKQVVCDVLDDLNRNPLHQNDVCISWFRKLSPGSLQDAKEELDALRRKRIASGNIEGALNCADILGALEA